MRVALFISVITCLLIALVSFLAAYVDLGFEATPGERFFITLVCFIFGYGCAKEYDNLN